MLCTVKSGKVWQIHCGGVDIVFPCNTLNCPKCYFLPSKLVVICSVCRYEWHLLQDIRVTGPLGAWVSPCWKALRSVSWYSEDVQGLRHNFMITLAIMKHQNQYIARHSWTWKQTLRRRKCLKNLSVDLLVLRSFMLWLSLNWWNPGLTSVWLWYSLVFWKLKSISQMPALQGRQRLKNARVSKLRNYRNSSFKQKFFVINKPFILTCFQLPLVFFSFGNNCRSHGKELSCSSSTTGGSLLQNPMILHHDTHL